jgi:hypothetical protein
LVEIDRDTSDSRLAALDARLRRAESALGGADDNRRPLTDTVEDLRLRLQLVQGGTLDALESRLNVLITKQAGQTRTPDKTLNDVHELMRQWETTCQALPAITTRLQVAS